MATFFHYCSDTSAFLFYSLSIASLRLGHNSLCLSPLPLTYLFVDAGITSISLSPHPAPYTLIAAGSLDCVVRLWDLATGTLLERLRGHRSVTSHPFRPKFISYSDSVYSVAFTPDGRGLVSGSLDRYGVHRLLSLVPVVTSGLML